MSYYDIPPSKEVKCGLKVKGYKGYRVSVVAGNIRSLLALGPKRWCGCGVNVILWARAAMQRRKMSEENSD